MPDHITFPAGSILYMGNSARKILGISEVEDPDNEPVNVDFTVALDDFRALMRIQADMYTWLAYEFECLVAPDVYEPGHWNYIKYRNYPNVDEARRNMPIREFNSMWESLLFIGNHV